MSNNLEILEQAISCEPQRPWMVLQVEDDEDDALLVDRFLKPKLPAGSTIDHVDKLSDAIQRMRETNYDAVLLDLSLPDSHGLCTLREVISQANSPPVVVLSGNEDPATVSDALSSGASDYVMKSRLSGTYLRDCLSQVVKPSCARESSGEQQIDAPITDVSEAVDDAYAITLPAIVISIQDDGGPGQELAATILQIAHNKLTLVAEVPAQTLTDLAMVGIETTEGDFLYATFQWTKQENEETRLRLEGHLLSRVGDPFHENKLVPKLDPKHFQFKSQMSDNIMRQWALRGVLTQRQIDRVKTCPQCTGLATFRDGCPRCGSAFTRATQLIHHFPCALVAPVGEFEADGLVCPKCRARDLVVGADFEYLDGPRNCTECRWTDVRTALLGECLACGLRFPGDKAHEKEIIQFYVPRLDLLALIEDRR
jgi:CheY-like chemotaxis protein